MEKPSVAFDPLPNSLPLQGKRALATHPPSCHPRRVFGNLERGKKMKENGERGKQQENCRPPSIAKSEVIDILYKLRLILRPEKFQFLE